jgi:hypothetical protein
MTLKQTDGLGVPYVNILLTISVIKEKISTEPGFYSVRKVKLYYVLIRRIIISVLIIGVYKFNGVLLGA